MPKRTTVRAGDYIQQVVFEVNSTPNAQDQYGAPVETWVTDFTVPGAYEPQPSRPQGAEFELALKRQSENRVLFRIRYRPGIDDSSTFVALHRIAFRNRTWNIMRAFDPDGLRIEIHVEATVVE